jgi:hypothetical protein
VSEIDDELSSHSPRKAAEVTSAPVAVVVLIAAAPSSALSLIAIIVDPHDSGRIDPFNQTMIIKSDSKMPLGKATTERTAENVSFNY